MKGKLSDKIKQENEVQYLNKKEIKGELTIGENAYIQNKCNIKNISSEYNVSGIGGYGLNLI